MTSSHIDNVRTAHKALQRLERKVADARAARDSAIRDAVAAGHSQTVVAEVTGMTRQAVQKIANPTTTGDKP